MSKILYVHNGDFSKPCANRVQVLNMCKAFKKIKEDITLMSFNCSRDLIKKNYNLKTNYSIVSLKPFLNYYFRSLQLFIKFLKIKNKFRYIFTRDLIFAFLVSKFTNKEVIYELHDLSKDSSWYFLFKRTFECLLKCVTVSRGIEQELMNIGLDKNKINVLHDAVDLNKFNINISKNKAREILNLPKDKTIVSYIGSLQNWKGYKTFLESFKYLNNKENYIYLIVGGTKNQIEKLKERYNNKNIIFIPFIDNSKIPIYLKASDILVIPNSSKYNISVKYTSPLKLFEYMASKRPIIASDLPSIREVVDNNEVLFFKPDDEIDLAEKTEMLISNKKLQNKMVKNAFKKVKDYTWEERAKKVIEIFKKEEDD